MLRSEPVSIFVTSFNMKFLEVWIWWIHKASPATYSIRCHCCCVATMKLELSEKAEKYFTLSSSLLNYSLVSYRLAGELHPVFSLSCLVCLHFSKTHMLFAVRDLLLWDSRVKITVPGDPVLLGVSYVVIVLWGVHGWGVSWLLVRSLVRLSLLKYIVISLLHKTAWPT